MSTDERQTEQQDADLRWLLTTRPRLVRRLLEKSGLFRLSYASERPMDTAFAEGARNLGLWLLAEALRVAPEAAGDLLDVEVKP